MLQYKYVELSSSPFARYQQFKVIIRVFYMQQQVYLMIAGFASLTTLILMLWLILKQYTHFSKQLNGFNQFIDIQTEQLKSNFAQQLQNMQHYIDSYFHKMENLLATHASTQREAADKRHIDHLKLLLDSQRDNALNLQQQILNTLSHHANSLDKKVNTLTEKTQYQLTQISGQVDQRLSEGFEKTNKTFTDIVKRLALIDAAQQKITELSSNVVSLQEILADKRSRGAFGEVQLSALLYNTIPKNHFGEQVTLSNGKRVDCLLYLPPPTGNTPIDAKFPLENFQTMMNIKRSESERKFAEQQFVQDIKKHINAIKDKYIIPGETSDGAMMFIPAEAVFAEIHSHYPELIEHAHKNKVWIVSPTTLMAVLTTARAVLKDEATRKQVHIIQEHLAGLAKDFGRFQTRMDKLGKHLEQANADVKDIHTSARKISNRFEQIEQVELKDSANLLVE